MTKTLLTDDIHKWSILLDENTTSKQLTLSKMEVAVEFLRVPPGPPAINAKGQRLPTPHYNK